MWKLLWFGNSVCGCMLHGKSLQVASETSYKHTQGDSYTWCDVQKCGIIKYKRTQERAILISEDGSTPSVSVGAVRLMGFYSHLYSEPSYHVYKKTVLRPSKDRRPKIVNNLHRDSDHWRMLLRLHISISISSLWEKHIYPALSISQGTGCIELCCIFGLVFHQSFYDLQK